MRENKGEAHPMPDGVRGRGRFLCSWPDVVEPTTYLSEASVRRPSKPTSSHHNSAHRHKSRVVSVVRGMIQSGAVLASEGPRTDLTESRNP